MRRRARRRGPATASRSARRRPPIAPAALVALALVAGAALVLGLRPRAPALPALVYEHTDDGVRIAEIDVAGVRRWCRANDLPDPPGLERMEAAVAENLMAALRAAGADRDPRRLGRIGQISESLEAHRAALAYFALAAERDPGGFRWPYFSGCVYQVLGRSEEAIASFERALAIDSSYPVTHARLGQLYLERGELEAAEAAILAYARMRPDDWLGHVGLARIALRRDRPHRALEHLQRAERLGPDDFQVHHYLGRTHAALGDTDRARFHFARAAELPQGAWFAARDPLDRELAACASSVASLATEFERLRPSGDWARLTRLAEQIVSRRSHDVTMLGNLAGLYRKVGRFADAHAILDRADAAGTDQLRLRNLRAEVFLAQGKFPETIAEAGRVLEIDPQSPRGHGVRARALLMQGRFPAAEASMRRSLDRDPSSAPNWFVLGEAVLNQGRIEEAADMYRRTVALDPAFETARGRLREIDALR